jgi:hypothetical protein
MSASEGTDREYVRTSLSKEATGGWRMSSSTSSSSSSSSSSSWPPVVQLIPFRPQTSSHISFFMVLLDLLFFL